MDPQKDAAYRWVLKEFIKKQILIFGPNITFAKVASVTGVEIDLQGNIIKLERSSCDILKDVLGKFLFLSPVIIKTAMTSILSSNPNLNIIKEEIAGIFDGLSKKPSVVNIVTPSTHTSVSSDLQAFRNGFQSGISVKPAETKQTLQDKNPLENISPAEGFESSKVEELEKMFEGVK